MQIIKMVSKTIPFTIRFLLVLLLMVNLPIAFAAQFEAVVSSNKVLLNQPIKLKLLLIDADPIESPDLTSLTEYFNIKAQQKYSNFSSINGKRTTETGWQIILTAKMPGELIIPVLSVKTKQGILYTQAVNLIVEQVTNTDNLAVKIIASVNKNQVFVQESFIYKAKISTTRPITNLNLAKFELKNCIVEAIDDPKQQPQINKTHDGYSIDLQYLITPLQPGPLEITGFAISGEVQNDVADLRGMDPFNNLSIFNSMVQMQQFEPFNLQAQPISVTINPGIAEVDPWLPLYDLEVVESWQGDLNATVGEPITREIKLTAKGITAAQLPDLKKFQEIPGVKVYADHPKTKQSFKSDPAQLLAHKIQQFSLIPTKAGELVLPEIAITWWDLTNSKVMITRLPAKTLQVVQSASAADQETIATDLKDSQQQLTATNVANKPDPQIAKQFNILYLIITILILVLLGVIWFFWSYLKKLQARSAAVTHIDLSNKADQTILVNPRQLDLKNVASIVVLQEFIRKYAQKNWQIAECVVLKNIPQLLTDNNYIFDQQLAALFFNNLAKALYGGEAIALNDLKKLWQEFAATVKHGAHSRSVANNNTKISNLNPT